MKTTQVLYNQEEEENGALIDQRILDEMYSLMMEFNSNGNASIYTDNETIDNNTFDSFDLRVYLRDDEQYISYNIKYVILRNIATYYKFMHIIYNKSEECAIDMIRDKSRSYIQKVVKKQKNK